jgi:hypothetical protein
LVQKRTYEHREILTSEFPRDHKSDDICAEDDYIEVVHRVRSVVLNDL